MAFLKLTYAGGEEEVVETIGESRVRVEGGKSAVLGTGTGVVHAAFESGEAELSEPDWDDPTFRREVRKLLAEQKPAAQSTLQLTYADGSEWPFVADQPSLEVKPGQIVPFNTQTGLVSVAVSDDDPRDKPKPKGKK